MANLKSGTTLGGYPISHMGNDLFSGNSSRFALKVNKDINAITKSGFYIADTNNPNGPPFNAMSQVYLTVIVGTGSIIQQLAVPYTTGSVPMIAVRTFDGSSTWTSWEFTPKMRYDSNDGTLYIRDDGNPA